MNSRIYRTLTWVTLYELLSRGGQWFFTMEYIESEDFLTHIRQDGEHTRLRSALRQLAEGVDALHRYGKLHCDLKPQNVLARKDGRITILDVYIESLQHSARAALALAAADRTNAQLRRELRRGAAREYSLVERSGAALQAGIAAARGAREESLLLLESAEPLLIAAGMALYGMAARHRRGCLLGGERGGELFFFRRRLDAQPGHSQPGAHVGHVGARILIANA